MPLIVFCLIGLAACPGNEPGDSTMAIQMLPSDDEILAKVYDTLYQVPDDFYVDERADTPRSYTVYHVKDSSLSYELCTDSHSQALTWEEADNESRSVQGIYVGSVDNDRYFEFIRELTFTNGIGNVSDPTSPGFSRVLKCSYANRDGVDRNIRNGHAGVLNIRPLAPVVIKTFTEYMWQFTFFWPANKKVLETFSTETENSYQHTLLLAFATNQGAGECDLVEIVDWTFSVSKHDGQITKEFKLLYDMEAQLVDNRFPQKC